MPRRARLVIPNCPHHIIQRGHNRQVVFAKDDDYLYYLDNLREWKTELGCKIYAYCLMTNHVHLIIDPGERIENLGLLMKRVAGRQTRYVNKREKRSGSLWEGRYKSSVVSANEYLLACCRYVELNPLRAGMVEDSWQYRWSSCPVKTGIEEQPWLNFDSICMSLGKTSDARAEKYRRWLRETVPEEEWKLIREVTQLGQLVSGKKFTREISERLGRRIELRGSGRPKKEKK